MENIVVDHLSCLIRYGSELSKGIMETFPNEQLMQIESLTLVCRCGELFGLQSVTT